MLDQADLFRKEVLEARRTRLDGEVLLYRPLRAHAVIALLTCIVIALGIWVATGRYARTEPARGVLVTDTETAKIIALRPGLITRLAVREGQSVRARQVLAVVQIDQTNAQGGMTTQDGLDAVQAQQRMTSQQIAAAQDRARGVRAALSVAISSSRGQYTAVLTQATIQQQLIESLQKTLERYGPVAEKGFISQTEIDRRQQEVLTARQELSRLQQQLTTLKAEQAKATAELRQADAEELAQATAARSSAEGFRAQQAQLRGQQAYVLTAPMDGEVAALQTGVGRTVDASMPLMSIVPSKATLHAEIYAPTRAIGFVHPGEEVRLLYDAFPYQRFGSFRGRVKSVSRVALDPRQIDAPFKIEEPVYRVSVIPADQAVEGYGERVRLQPGMTLAAIIVLERRSFLQWLLEPLNAVVKRDR